MSFVSVNYRETRIGAQVWELGQAIIAAQEQWEPLPQAAIGAPLVDGMAQLMAALREGYGSDSYPAVAAAFRRAGESAGEVEAALQDAIRHELLETAAAYSLDREICQVKALLHFVAEVALEAEQRREDRCPGRASLSSTGS